MRGDRPGARAIFHVSGGQFVGRNRIDMGAADSRVVISGGSFMLASHVDMGYASRDGAESLLHIVGSAPQQVVITSLLCSRHVENRLGAATLKFTLDESGGTPVYVMRLFGPSAGDKLVVDVSRYRGRDEEIVLVDCERMDGRQWQSADIKIVGGTASVKFDGGDGTAVVLEDIRRADVR